MAKRYKRATHKHIGRARRSSLKRCGTEFRRLYALTASNIAREPGGVYAHVAAHVGSQPSGSKTPAQRNYRRYHEENTTFHGLPPATPDAPRELSGPNFRQVPRTQGTALIVLI